VRLTVAIAVYIKAPRTVLRISGFLKAYDSDEDSQDEQRKPHGSLLFAPLKTPVPHLYFQRPVRPARRIAANIAKLPELLGRKD